MFFLDLQKSFAFAATTIAVITVLVYSSWGTTHNTQSTSSLASISTVNKKRNRYLTSPKHTRSRTPTHAGLSCLERAFPGIEKRLAYPSDAEDHFFELHLALSNWTRGVKPHYASYFRGPWIENYWITLNPGTTKRLGNGVLKQQFGPFIPIFVPWTDIWCGNWYSYTTEFLDALDAVLRPDVAYVTVNQNDDGLFGRCTELCTQKWPNILVLSAGGVGHIPIPLLKQPLQTQNKISPEKRKYDVSFVGSLTHGPANIRQHMSEIVTSISKETGLRTVCGKFANWSDFMVESRLQLVPRGYGRTSYHLVEALHMGLQPIHVYFDIPWVPYADRMSGLIHSVRVTELDVFLRNTSVLSPEYISRVESEILSLKSSHFSGAGILQQIQWFLQANGTAPSDLRCAVYKPNFEPKNPKDTQMHLRTNNKC